MAQNILITGATGFIGRSLCRHLRLKGYAVRPVVRRKAEQDNPADPSIVVIDDINADTLWSSVLQDMDVVIHLAACTAVSARSSGLSDDLFRTNVAGTLALARQAADAGVKRFIFLSSAKVGGEETRPGHVLTEDDPANPQDAYASSKYQAETSLHELADETGLEVTIIRPPLVYGLGGRGHVAAMINCINRGVPLPLGSIRNQRSLIGMDNLVDFIALCLAHPAAAHETFLVSDDKDLSTPELLRLTAEAMGRSVRLVSLPTSFLKLGAQLLGRPHLAQKLCGNFQVDSSKARQLLGWQPPLSVAEGIKRSVAEPPAFSPDAFRAGVLRFFDICLAGIGLVLAFPIMGIIALLGLFDTGAPLFCQERVGREKKPFVLLKFRTMRRDAPSVASHLADGMAITGFGRFLRKSKLDELPQLWNVLTGDMSLVGPRPCLFSQEELIEARERLGVYAIRPGITGLAQINNIDMSTPELLAETDARMIRELTVSRYFCFILQTVIGRGVGDRIR